MPVQSAPARVPPPVVPCALESAEVSLHRAIHRRASVQAPAPNGSTAVPCSGLTRSIAQLPESVRKPTTAVSPDRYPSFLPPGMPSRVLHSDGVAHLWVNPGAGE